MDDNQIELSPFTAGERPLDGFIVSGRWPDDHQEWAQLLRLLVRIAAVPGILARTSIFRSLDEKPEVRGGTTLRHPVGMLVMAGSVIGADALAPGALGHPQPEAVLLLHPPGESQLSSTSGCVLLPGLPHLGLDHRAAWVDSDPDGTVTRLVSRTEIDPGEDPDTAVLALMLAA